MSVFLVMFVASASARLFQKRICETLLFSILIQTLVMFMLDRVFGGLLPGLYLNIAMILLAFIYCVIKVFSSKAFASLLLSPEIIAWLFIVLFFAKVCMSRDVTNYDDLLVWALNVKNMVYFDAISPSGGTIVSNYPPATMLWNYLACKTWIGYSDGIVFWAYNTYVTAAFFPLLSAIKGKYQYVKSLILTLVIIMLPIAALSYSYSSLGSDVLLAGLFFAGTYNIFMFWKTNDMFYGRSILLIIYAVTLTKRIGIVFGFMLIFILAIVMFRQDFCKCIVNRNRNTYLFLATLVGILSYCFFYGIKLMALLIVIAVPMGYIACNYKKGYYFFKRNRVFSFISFFLMFLLGCGAIFYFNLREERAKTIELLFVKSLFESKACFKDAIIPFSLMEFLFVTGIVFFVLLHLKTQKNSNVIGSEEQVIGNMTIWMIVSMSFYLLALLATYITQIAFHGEELLSFDRYMIPVYLTLTMWLLYIGIKQNRLDSFIVYVGIIAMAMALTSESTIIDYLTESGEDMTYPGIDANKDILTINDKICYVNCGRDIEDFDVAFRYYVAPILSNATSALGINGYDEDRHILNYIEFGKYLMDGEYDYLYLDGLTEEFSSDYKMLFYGEIKNDSLYRICPIEDTVALYIVE